MTKLEVEFEAKQRECDSINFFGLRISSHDVDSIELDKTAHNNRFSLVM